MSPEAQRIAIAEACGWKRYIFEDGRFEKWPDFSWDSPCGQWRHGFCMLPKYLEDLNAMHEAEKVVLDEQPSNYAEWLWQVVFSGHPGDITSSELASFVHATAAQRAEAFLRTLNLWTQ